MENKVCLAYLFSGCLTDKSLTDVLRKIDFKKLTYLSVAFVLFEEQDGVWMPILDAETAAEIPLLKAEIERQQANTKILLSVGGAGMDGFCQVSRTAESRETFAKEIRRMADAHGVDGIDIDWEFPGSGMLGITHCKHCKKDYILLLEALRRHLRERLLTVAVGGHLYLGVDKKMLGRLVDYVFVMTYDLGVYHSSAPKAKSSVSAWHLAGIPKEKLCIGVPFYGKNVKNLAETVGYTDARTGEISHTFGQSFSWYQGKKWCLDMPSDAKSKARWVYGNGFGGVFCWEITTDFDNQMLGAMCDGIEGK